MFRTGDRWEADMVGPVSHKYYGTAGCAVLLYKTPGFPETIIGTKGEKVPGHFKDRPEGIWEGQNEINIFPRSLYVAQLMARQKGADLRILTK